MKYSSGRGWDPDSIFFLKSILKNCVVGPNFNDLHSYLIHIILYYSLIGKYSYC